MKTTWNNERSLAIEEFHQEFTREVYSEEFHGFGKMKDWCRKDVGVAQLIVGSGAVGKGIVVVLIESCGCSVSSEVEGVGDFVAAAA